MGWFVICNRVNDIVFEVVNVSQFNNDTDRSILSYRSRCHLAHVLVNINSSMICTDYSMTRAFTTTPFRDQERILIESAVISVHRAGKVGINFYGRRSGPADSK